MEYVMLAEDYTGQDPTGGLLSEKLDGQRAWWDGGISRGEPKKTIPWANKLKDNRYKEPPIATGLWTRYGNVVHAPGWWLDQLPKGITLDGELYIGRGEFQRTRSIVSRLVPGPEWSEVRFKIIDSPPPERLFERRTVRVTGGGKVLVSGDDRCRDLRTIDYGSGGLEWIEQITCRGSEHLDEYLSEIVSVGGEGVILRSSPLWVPRRVGWLVKLKPEIDGEGLIVGWTPGKGKYAGSLGALVIELRSGVRCELSGMSDWEREHYKEFFPIGSVVNWVAMGYTESGALREGRYVNRSGD